MEFLSVEAEEEGVLLQFSEDESAKITDELDNFINGEPIDEEDVSSYRERNPLNTDDYPKFNGQVRNPLEPIFSDDESYFGEDEQPDLYAPENEKK